MARRIATYGMFALAFCIFGVLAFDYGYFVYRQRHGSPLSFVTVRQYLATPLKNGKDELDFIGETDQPCVVSLMPHQHMSPCWWVRAHKDHWTQS